MTQKIQRSVFIGLGGTGQSALLHLKRKLIDVYGTVPAACSFLCFDTDAPTSLQTRKGEPVTLSAGEFFKLEVKTPRPVTQGPEVAPWWSKKIHAKVISKGAGGVRQVGRLGLFANSQLVLSKTQAAVERVSAWPVGRTDNDQFEVIDNSVNVHVIGSLAGGTGAGMFLDLGVIAQSLTSSLDTVIAHLLMPDAFVRLPGVYNAERNAYAAAQEMDLLWSMRGEADYSYRLNGVTLPLREAPFDVVCLINNNSGGTSYMTLSDLKEFVGLGAFLSTGKVGQEQASIWDNIAQRAPHRDSWDDRKPNYTSYGLAELFFDRERYAKFYALRIAHGLVNRLFFSGNQLETAAEVRSFLLSRNLVEDDGDQVIDAILTLGDFTKFVAPQAPTPEELRALSARRDGYLSQVARELDARASASGVELRTQKLEEMHAFVQERLTEPGGFAFARSFLESLTGTFEAFRKMMEEERQRHIEQAENAITQYSTLTRDAEQAAQAFLGGADRKRRAAANIAMAFMGEASLKLEIRRREEAMAFFAALGEESKRLTAVLTNVAQVAHTATEELGLSIERMRSSRDQAKPFEILLEPPGLYDVPIGEFGADFLTSLAKSGMSLSDLGQLRLEAFVDLLVKYAEDQPLVRDMLDMSIDDAAAKLSETERAKYMETLFKTSAPLWCYNDGEVKKYGGVETVRLIGLPSKEKSPFDTDVLAAAGGDVTDTVASTGDPQRVFVLTAEYSLPAFVIDNFPLYRERFLQLPVAEREQYYINRAWIKDTVDLMPKIRSGESVKWAAALAMPTIKEGAEFAFGGIKQVGSTYYYVSPGQGDRTKGYEIKLGQGRVKACEAFLDSPECIAEVEAQLSAELDSRGKATVADAVRRFQASLEKESRNIKQEDVRAQVRQELEDLDELYDDITIIS